VCQMIRVEVQISASVGGFSVLRWPVSCVTTPGHEARSQTYLQCNGATAMVYVVESSSQPCHLSVGRTYHPPEDMWFLNLQQYHDGFVL
jgi:hypothetical protein